MYTCLSEILNNYLQNDNICTRKWTQVITQTLAFKSCYALHTYQTDRSICYVKSKPFPSLCVKWCEILKQCIRTHDKTYETLLR